MANAKSASPSWRASVSRAMQRLRESMRSSRPPCAFGTQYSSQPDFAEQRDQVVAGARRRIDVIVPAGQPRPRPRRRARARARGARRRRTASRGRSCRSRSLLSQSPSRFAWAAVTLRFSLASRSNSCLRSGADSPDTSLTTHASCELRHAQEAFPARRREADDERASGRRAAPSRVTSPPAPAGR